MKTDLKMLLAILLLLPAIGAGQDIDQQKQRVLSIVARIDERRASTARGFVRERKLNYRRTVSEEWIYCARGGEIEYVSIEYREGKTHFKEIYYLAKKKLIYAEESETTYVDEPGSDIVNAWHGEFFFAGGQLIDATTYGHGKSEADGWDPRTETPARAAARLRQLRRKAKRND